MSATRTGLAPSSQPSLGARLARTRPQLLVAVAGCGLAAGGVLHLAGAADAGRLAWDVTGGLGALYALWAMVEALWRSRIGVDAIALLAVVGALAVGEPLAAAVVAVMLLTGRALESWAAGRAWRDLARLLERAPRVAHRVRGGDLVTVPVGEVEPGDLLVVGAGELVPVDGNLCGSAVLDESALTGEALPVELRDGDPVRSGVLNAGRPFELRATASASHSAYAGVVRLVESAASSRAPFVQMADRYAVAFLAVSLAGAGLAWALAGPVRAVAVLVVATPCPLILAAPVALVSGVSRAARRGIVVKGAAALERLAGATSLLFDKTGTLTTGAPHLEGVAVAGGWSVDEVLGLAASVDQISSHVLATAVVRAARERGCELETPCAVEELPGEGIRGTVGVRRVAVGNAGWTGTGPSPDWARSARRRALALGALTIYVSVDGDVAGILTFGDPIRADAARVVRLLRRVGFERLAMVTGDRAEVAESVGSVVGLDAVFAERSPEEKLQVVRSERRAGQTVMVGDGINDAPALALADVGVAMGARGSTVSTEAADIVLTVDRLDRLVEARAIAVETRRVAVQSVLVGMFLSGAAMVVAGLGYLPPVWGAVLQEVIDVTVIVNALRALLPGRSTGRLQSEASAMARRFSDEHRAVRGVARRARDLADSIGMPGGAMPADVVGDARRVHRELVDVVVPHEAAEELELYPQLDRAIGGINPTEPMSRGHAEIVHQVSLLGQFLGDVGAEELDGQELDGEDLVELRRLLYSLSAVLLLHTAQEEESYLSLADEPREGASAARGG